MNKQCPLKLPAPGEVVTVRVFVNRTGGGNPVPLVADAQNVSSAQMQQVALDYGHESAFVLPSADTRCDWRFRFFVPEHEMEMCGHACVGTLWALRQWRIWNSAAAVVETCSGLIDAWWDETEQRVWISQPLVNTRTLSEKQRRQVAHVLAATTEDMPMEMINASTSRVKTLVPLHDVDMLNKMSPDFGSIKQVCEAIDSTGLYPYAIESNSAEASVIHARQFPKSSGYPEDAATGIAAAALWGHLVNAGVIGTGTARHPELCTILQGEAMGCPSAIFIKARFDDIGNLQGCWLSGAVEWVPS